MKRISFILFAALLFSFLPEKLPNVLIIGDSISLGYTPLVQEAFEEEARIIHNLDNLV